MVEKKEMDTLTEEFESTRKILIALGYGETRCRP